MKISFPPSARNNSGILYQCTHSSSNFLINCGIDFSRPGSEEKQALSISHGNRQPDFIVLTSGKADHCALLPLLKRNGFTGPVYGTASTIRMARLTLKEMAVFSEEKSNWLHKNGRRLGLLTSAPLFTQKETDRLSNQFTEVKDCQWISLTPFLKLNIKETPGSIVDIVRIHETLDGKITAITSTGTLARDCLSSLKATVPSDSPDLQSVDEEVLLYDCSMSRENSPWKKNLSDCLKPCLKRAIEENGKLFLVVSSPSEYIDLLSALSMVQDTESPTPIYLDSPVAQSILNEALSRGLNSTFLDSVIPLSTSTESKDLNNKDQNLIVITSNAIEGGGRLAHHLKHNLWAEKNQFLLCYKATPNTLSATLTEARKSLWLFGCRVLFNSSVTAIPDLIPQENTVILPPENLSSIFLTFEDENFVFGLEESLRKESSVNSYIPFPGETLSIGEGKPASTLRTVYEEPVSFSSAVENDLACELSDFQRAVEEAGLKLDALTGELALWANQKKDPIEAVSGCSKVVKIIIDSLSSLGTEGIGKAESTITQLATTLEEDNDSQNSEALAALNVVRSTITDS